MKKVERGEILGIADYEKIREPFRARVIQEKKARRIAFGDRATCLFENHDTVLMQIQEMLRTERITREASILHEIETYNELIPGPRELSTTILLEIEDKATRDQFLIDAVGLETQFAVIIDGEKCPGQVDPNRQSTERTTAVHYVKFDLGEKAERRLRDVVEKKAKATDLDVKLVSTHPKYPHEVKLPAALVQSLADDLL
jgi:hypothetical protein